MTLESIHIKNRGPLVNFKADFGPITVIYGPNASGKSLLSNTLRAIERERWCGPGEAVVTIDGSTLHSREFDDGKFKDRVRVFNANFLRDDVMVDNVGAIVLGRELIGDRTQIARCERKLEQLSDFRKQLDDDLRTMANELSQSQTNIGRRIEQVLKTASGMPGFKGEWNFYNKTKAAARYERMIREADHDRHRRDYAELDQLASTITQRTSKQHPPITGDLKLSDIRKQAVELCNTRLPDAKLPEVEADPDLRDWLSRGREYLRQEDRCGFCHQDVPKARVEELKAYFNDSLTQLLDEIDALINQVSRIGDTLRQASIPPFQSIRRDLRDSYEQHAERWTTSRDNVLTELSEIKKHLETKRNNPNEIIVIAAMESSWDAKAADAIASLIQEHNSSVINPLDACEEYESGMIAGVYDEWQLLETKMAKRKAQSANADRWLKKTTSQLNELKRSADTRLIAADQLTDMVRSFLGHDEIGFMLKDDHAYQLTRHGQPATDFSEGERTALALMYFLKRLEDESFENQKGTLVFDDPITSFDEDNLYRAVADIITMTGIKNREHALTKCNIIFLTHHFGLFERLWMELRSGRDEGTARFFEMHCRFQNRKRVTRLIKSDNLPITDYTLAFSEVKSMADGCRKINNPETSIRKCVEGFLTRMAPGTIDQGLTSAYWSFVNDTDQEVVSKEDLQLIISIANGGSHLSGLPRRADSERHWSTLETVSTQFLWLMKTTMRTHHDDLRKLHYRRIKQEARAKRESDV